MLVDARASNRAVVRFILTEEDCGKLIKEMELLLGGGLRTDRPAAIKELERHPKLPNTRGLRCVFSGVPVYVLA